MQVADRAVEMLKPYKDKLDWDGAFSVVSSYDRTRTEKLGILLYVMLCYVMLCYFPSFYLISFYLKLSDLISSHLVLLYLNLSY